MSMEKSSSRGELSEIEIGWQFTCPAPVRTGTDGRAVADDLRDLMTIPEANNRNVCRLEESRRMKV